MKRRFDVQHGRVVAAVDTPPKRCRTCGESFPLDERHFKRKRNAYGLNKGWGPDCLVCASRQITQRLASEVKPC